MELSRRNFLATTGAVVAGAKLSDAAWAATAFPNPANEVATDDPVPALEQLPTTREGDMQYRTLGKTGAKVSIVGLGGFHLGKINDETQAIKLCRCAIDSGLNFMDNCWDYNKGRSEEIMGKALRDGYRQKAFLMTKLDGRTKNFAAKQLEESMKRLQADVVDLVMIHEVIRLEDPDRCFAKDGAIEAYLDAKKAGKLKYIGFTGHKDPLVHLRMLEVAKQHGFHFDVVLMPLNVMDAHFRSFAHHVLPVALKEQTAVINMKPFAGGEILKANTGVTPIECLHYAMNLPTCVCITGCESDKDLDQALEAAKIFKPMTKEQVATLLAKTRQAAIAGAYEHFKTQDRFDGTAKHIEWMAPVTEAG